MPIYYLFFPKRCKCCLVEISFLSGQLLCQMHSSLRYDSLVIRILHKLSSRYSRVKHSHVTLFGFTLLLHTLWHNNLTSHSLASHSYVTLFGFTLLLHTLTSHSLASHSLASHAHSSYLLLVFPTLSQERHCQIKSPSLLSIN